MMHSCMYNAELPPKDFDPPRLGAAANPRSSGALPVQSHLGSQSEHTVCQSFQAAAANACADGRRVAQYSVLRRAKGNQSNQPLTTANYVEEAWVLISPLLLLSGQRKRRIATRTWHKLQPALPCSREIGKRETNSSECHLIRRPAIWSPDFAFLGQATASIRRGCLAIARTGVEASGTCWGLAQESTYYNFPFINYPLVSIAPRVT